MRKRLLQILLILIVFFMGAASNFLLFEYYVRPVQVKETLKTEIKAEETVIEEAIGKVYDSVVVVESLKNGNKVSSGTGFVYKVDNKNGYIMTNNHVVSDVSEVMITFSSEERVAAKVLGKDIYADIAVLSVPKEKVIEVAEIGNPLDLKLGNTVFAIGAPISVDYSGTVTRGVVSGKDRLVPISLSGGSGSDWLMRVIQTDAAINPGNSGGPLVNILGKVIGINSLKLVSNQVEGIGFAIPIDDAMEYVGQLENGLEIMRPALGVHLIDVNETLVLFYNNIIVDEDIEEGTVIQEVVNGSPAEKAGLKKGDVILKIADKKIKNKAELRYELYKHKVGSKIKITYYRSKKIYTTEVLLKEIADL